MRTSLRLPKGHNFHGQRGALRSINAAAWRRECPVSSSLMSCRAGTPQKMYPSRNPVRPIARGKFLPPSPELASCPLEREAWPQNSESPSTNCRSSRPMSSRNIVSTSPSTRGSGLPPVSSRRCGARTGICRSAATSARTASAASSAAASRKRQAGEAAISSRPRSPISPGARLPIAKSAR